MHRLLRSCVDDTLARTQKLPPFRRQLQQGRREPTLPRPISRADRLVQERSSVRAGAPDQAPRELKPDATIASPHEGSPPRGAPRNHLVTA
jgi:hypothetical protein